MNAILAGEDEYELGDALEAEGVELTRVDGIATRPALEEAGVTDSDLFVLTEAAGATAIPIARDLNDDLRVIVYTDDNLPDFARGQTDFIVDPDLLSAEAVAEELTA